MSTAVSATTATWNIDPVHSTAQFKVKHLMISNVRGEFTHISGALELDSHDITNSRVEATIDVATINTREPQRDAHLKSADFFDVEKFPTLSFKSTHISKSGEAELVIDGDLTIHGVTRKVVLEAEGPTAPMTDPWGSTRIGLSATTHIKRKDFGLNWNTALDSGGVMVGEDIAITLDVEFIKA